MLNHETNIDTVALQIDFINAEEQRITLGLLYNWITGRRLGRLQMINNYSSRVIKNNLLCGGRKVATIHTGATRSRNKVTGQFQKIYYIRIRFAGLKSYNKALDENTLNCLMSICAYLNTTNTVFRLTELDIAIDAFCPFNNILVCCTKESANVPYNPLGYTWKGNLNSYSEFINSEIK